MKILVTGGTGFIGNNWIRYDLKINAGNKYLVVGRDSERLTSIRRLDFDAIETIRVNDLNDISSGHLNGVDVLLHLSAHSLRYPYDSLQNCIIENVWKPLSLFNRARSVGVRKFVVTGSYFEYGLTDKLTTLSVDRSLKPNNSYAISKAVGSVLFKEFAVENNLVLHYHRLFQVYGDYEHESRLYPSLIKAARNHSDFPMTEGTQIRDFINAKDVAKKLSESIRCKPSECYNFWLTNIGTGNPLSIKEFALRVWEEEKASGNILFGQLQERGSENYNSVADCAHEMLI